MDNKRIQDDFDVNTLLSQLNLSEKIDLISGTDFWHTAGVPRLGIPVIRMSDGPNGVRGTKFFNGVKSACLPCGTSLGATWNTPLIKEGGNLMGQEAIAKGACVLLAPTTNLQRTLLGGRGFESFSEDPYLSGAISAASVSGIQSTGVAATIKHFVCNDQEDRRMSSNSVLTQRAMRELYLMPFQIAQRDAKPMCFMTAYNLINGTHCSENSYLLRDILREEWGFGGLVMSDWLGTYSTCESIKAGLDLEMPGPAVARAASIVARQMNSGKLHEADLDACVRKVLELVKKTLPLEIPEHAPEKGNDTPETSVLLRRIGAEGIVLLKNDNQTLPFDASKKLAVIGPNAARATYCGGGSASLDPYYAITPLDGFKAQAKQVEYSLGAVGYKRLPLLSELATDSDGKKGLNMAIYLESSSHKDRKPVDSFHTDTSYVTLFDYAHEKITTPLFYVTLDGTVKAEQTSDYDFSCSCAGTAKVYVEGELVVDNATEQEAGDSFFGMGTVEVVRSIKLEAGKEYNVHVDFGTLPTKKYSRDGTTSFGPGGLRIGFHRKVEKEEEINAAVKVARSVDQIVLCVGLDGDWESEGYDRKHMDLPPGVDDLIAAVIEANPNTAVVIQSGTPVTMPWLDKAAAVIQAWYGGNETGNSIADIVLGVSNPSGKLPLTFPACVQDTPGFHMINDGTTVQYGEDIFMGYRFFEKVGTPVAFPFGHGMSYTNFEMSDVRVQRTDDEVKVSVKVSNTGKRSGQEVVQVYVQALDTKISRPVKELKGFEKINVEAGSSETACITIPVKYATSYWDETRNMWACEKGRYKLRVGNSSDNTPLSAEFSLPKTFYWKGV